MNEEKGQKASERVKTPQVYGDLFDFYMERGEMPPQFAGSDDPLADYVREVADEPGNRRLMEEDSLWRDIMREALGGFFEGMVPMFGEIDGKAADEAGMIDEFFEASLDKKREMWQGIVQHIKQNYAPEEVNVDGYSRLMRDTPGDLNDIFDALHTDWQRALAQRTRRLKQQALERNKPRFEQSVREAGRHDYETVLATEATVGRYPQLREILLMMGRDKEASRDEFDATVTRYVPVVLSRSPEMSDIDGVTVGNDLRRMIPAELVRLSDSAIDIGFYADFAARRLRLFSTKPPSEKREKTELEKRRRPRLKEGPMIVSVDTSSSMSGHPEKIAKALVMQILRVAKRKRRKLFLITYSIRSKSIELTSRKGYAEVKKFMRSGFTGGTNGEMMLGAVLRQLSTEDFSMADVLIISDFDFPYPLKTTERDIRREQAKGVRFYGLAINSDVRQYSRILDRSWKI